MYQIEMLLLHSLILAPEVHHSLMPKADHLILVAICNNSTAPLGAKKEESESIEAPFYDMSERNWHNEATVINEFSSFRLDRRFICCLSRLDNLLVLACLPLY